MASQRNLDEAYMECARAIARLSRAERKKVGAILVAAGGIGIIAEGYNGTPAGFDNVCEVYTMGFSPLSIPSGVSTHQYQSILVTKPEVLHAESNAIAKIAQSTNSSKGSTLYVTVSPCFGCSLYIIQAGIKRVVYEELYRLEDGIELLKKANIQVECFTSQ